MTRATINGVEGHFEPGENWSENYTKERWNEIFIEAREYLGYPIEQGNRAKTNNGYMNTKRRRRKKQQQQSK